MKKTILFLVMLGLFCALLFACARTDTSNGLESSTIPKAEESVNPTDVLDEKSNYSDSPIEESNNVIQAPKEEMLDVDFTTIKVQIDNKIFTAPFTLNDLCSLGYTVEVEREKDSLGDVRVADISNGSLEMDIFGDFVEPYYAKPGESFSNYFVRFYNGEEIQQSFFASFINIQDEEVLLGDCVIYSFPWSGYYGHSEMHPLFDVIFPGGFSYYEPIPQDELTSKLKLKPLSSYFVVDFPENSILDEGIMGGYSFSQRENGEYEFMSYSFRDYIKSIK